MMECSVCGKTAYITVEYGPEMFVCACTAAHLVSQDALRCYQAMFMVEQ